MFMWLKWFCLFREFPSFLSILYFTLTLLINYQLKFSSVYHIFQGNCHIFQEVIDPKPYKAPVYNYILIQSHFLLYFFGGGRGQCDRKEETTPSGQKSCIPHSVHHRIWHMGGTYMCIELNLII